MRVFDLMAILSELPPDELITVAADSGEVEADIIRVDTTDDHAVLIVGDPHDEIHYVLRFV